MPQGFGRYVAVAVFPALCLGLFTVFGPQKVGGEGGADHSNEGLGGPCF